MSDYDGTGTVAILLAKVLWGSILINTKEDTHMANKKNPDTLIRLRAVPKKPSAVRKWTTAGTGFYGSIDSGLDIKQEILTSFSNLKREDIKDEEILIGGCGCYYSCDCDGSLRIEFQIRESQEFIDERMASYENDKITYDCWYATNEDLIVREVARRAKLKADKENRVMVQKAATRAAELDSAIKKAKALLKKHGVK